MSDSQGEAAWTWDVTLFQGAAPYYEAGRLPYAPGIAEALQAELGLDGTGRLVDLGCGPGVVTVRLAPLFADAVGLDPDPAMVDHARRRVEREGVANARFVLARAEDLPSDLAPIRVATLAASFHWMERPKVAALLHAMVEPGGAAVQVDAPGYRSDDLGSASRRAPLPHPLPPDPAIDELRSRYLGPRRRAGQGIRDTSPDREDEVFQAAGFPPALEVVVPDGRVLERTVDQIVAMRFSSSPTAPHLFGDRKDAFEADLRALLLDTSPSGRFSVRLPDNVLRIWRR